MVDYSYWESEEIRSYFLPKEPNPCLVRLLREHAEWFKTIRSVFDIGCGYGRNLLPFFSSERELYACDPCAGALAYTQARFHLPESHVRQLALEDEPWQGELQFDFVVCDGVLHQCRGRAAMERAAFYLASTVSSEGFLFVSVFTMDILPTDSALTQNSVWRTDQGMLMTLLSAESIVELFNGNGLVPVGEWREQFLLPVGRRSNVTLALRKERVCE